MGFGVGSRQDEENVERKRKFGRDEVTLCERSDLSHVSSVRILRLLCE